jgi:hypothetical protein
MNEMTCIEDETFYSNTVQNILLRMHILTKISEDAATLSESSELTLAQVAAEDRQSTKEPRAQKSASYLIIGTSLLMLPGPMHKRHAPSSCWAHGNVGCQSRESREGPRITRLFHIAYSIDKMQPGKLLMCYRSFKKKTTNPERVPLSLPRYRVEGRASKNKGASP